MEHKNLIAAYEVANNNSREVLRKLYPEVDFDGALKAMQNDNRPITERIKTFEDACAALGDDNALVNQYLVISGGPEMDETGADVLAYLKLRIICAALNEGWEPKFGKNEVRWYPWFWLYSTDEINRMNKEDKAKLIPVDEYQTGYAGFAYAASRNAPSSAAAYFGSRLCLKSEALAKYCGKQFVKLWADFNLTRK